MITIDPKQSKVILHASEGQPEKEFDLADPEAFRLITDYWLRATWDTKYVYSFAWMGRPIIQLPDDLIRMQELVFSVQPDVIVETGIAHGGSLIFYASLLKSIGKGRVVGVDLEIRPHNRTAIENHFLNDWITMIECDSVADEALAQVRAQIGPEDKVLVVLDSCHTKEHVGKELDAYGPLVTPGSYLVVTDGIMELVAGGPRTDDDWSWNNPKQAAQEFLEGNPDFEQAAMKPFAFNEGVVENWVSYFPDGLLRRKP